MVLKITPKVTKKRVKKNTHFPMSKNVRPFQTRVVYPPFDSFHILPATHQSKVGPGADTKLVRRFLLIPHTAATLSDGRQLVSNSLSEAAVFPFIRSIDDPFDCCPPTLSQRQRNGNLKSRTTTCNTLLLSDLNQRSNRVHDQSKEKDGVQRQLRTGGSGEQRTLRVGLRRGGSPEVIQDKGHIL